MSSRRLLKSPVHVPTMHAWAAKHNVLSAVIILIAVGAFAHSWS
jgi:hypothetical protein